MSFAIWCELVCDHCAKTTAGRHVFGSALPRREMKKDAIAAGWRFVDEQTYCSKRCAELEGHDAD